MSIEYFFSLKLLNSAFLFAFLFVFVGTETLSYLESASNI